MNSDELRQAVRGAGQRAEVLAALAELYAVVQTAIDARRPVCAMSGRCCRFEEFGHRLFVTTIELAGFVHDLELSRSGGVAVSIADDTIHDCPFQSGHLCGVHAIRPFGCRMFFCDASAGDWQAEQYEVFHQRLKRLHEEMGVAYFYLEWREALRWLSPGSTSDNGGPAR
jgi:Fe-S-cluster containining protein